MYSIPSPKTSLFFYTFSQFLVSKSSSQFCSSEFLFPHLHNAKFRTCRKVRARHWRHEWHWPWHGRVAGTAGRLGDGCRAERRAGSRGCRADAAISLVQHDCRRWGCNDLGWLECSDVRVCSNQCTVHCGRGQVLRRVPQNARPTRLPGAHCGHCDHARANRDRRGHRPEAGHSLLWPRCCHPGSVAAARGHRQAAKRRRACPLGVLGGRALGVCQLPHRSGSPRVLAPARCQRCWILQRPCVGRVVARTPDGDVRACCAGLCLDRLGHRAQPNFARSCPSDSTVCQEPRKVRPADWCRAHRARAQGRLPPRQPERQARQADSSARRSP
ncbi:hypothetical protein CAOG_001925 [Capsaspora owczarzaki ATCC 30864]|uniref:Uncharacterized protein n=1 Tax=Capsaspora owczarzaki (strain ATCC 30864) TaxID=595528 RepID=A0A0D2WLE9_CAPO3|nr:hypothetical protein CAOG_001925 [Capsaspora owczarzaki ATCC 30864]